MVVGELRDSVGQFKKVQSEITTAVLLIRVVSLSLASHWTNPLFEALKHRCQKAELDDAKSPKRRKGVAIIFIFVRLETQ